MLFEKFVDDFIEAAEKELNELEQLEQELIGKLPQDKLKELEGEVPQEYIEQARIEAMNQGAKKRFDLEEQLREFNPIPQSTATPRFNRLMI